MATAAIDPKQTTSGSADIGAHRSRRAQDVACRALDVVVAAILLVVLLPLMALIAAVIRLDSPGPAVFRQRRLGRALSPFTVHKFRTMEHGASDEIHRAFVLGLIAGQQPKQEGRRPQFKLATDRRLTKVGRLLRKSSLDELPQLWDVLQGKMSLVGPRPALAYEVEHYPPSWLARFNVQPGITGLWQVSGRSRLSMEDMAKLDIEYVERRSFSLNVWILVRTIPAVLNLRGAA